LGIYASDCEEVWRDVVGWEDRYEVSSLGIVKSKSYLKHTENMHGPMSFWTKPKVMRQTNNASGYLTIDLRRDKTRATGLVHRLVATAFLENPENLPIVNHMDSNRKNNCKSNLEWCTHQYNVQHSYDTGSNSNAGDLHPRKVLSEALVREMRLKYNTGTTRKQLVEEYGFKYCTIDKAVRGINWSQVT